MSFVRDAYMLLRGSVDGVLRMGPQLRSWTVDGDLLVDEVFDHRSGGNRGLV